MRTVRRPPCAVPLLRRLAPTLVLVGTVLSILLTPVTAEAGNGRHGVRPLQPDEEETQDEKDPAAAVDDEIVVVANLEPEPAQTVGSSVTVITREQIERRRQLTLLELLRTTPGLEVTQTGGFGKVASVRIRGGDASQTLVLIDGVRVNDATTGDFDFADLMSEHVERVEIVRGPQAIYGSEAVSGVVSITTRAGGSQRRLDVGAEAGEDDLRAFHLSTGGSSERLDWAITGSDVSIEGVSHNSERLGNRELDPYQNESASARVAASLGEHTRVLGALRYTDGENALDGFLEDDPNAMADRRTLAGSLELSRELGRSVSQSLLVAVNDTDLEGRDPDTIFNNYRIRARTSRLESRTAIQVAPESRLTIGLAHEERAAENVGGFDESVTISSAFLHDRWSLGERFHLSAAARVDDHSEHQAELTWRLTGAWLLPAQGTRVHASAGTAFRAPDLNELYFPFSGNLELEPETSEGYDLGIERRWERADLRAGVTVFYSTFEQLIDFDLVTFAFRNLGRARSQGAELELSARLGERVTATASHTWNETEDRATGFALARRPEHRTALVVDADLGERVRLGLAAIAVRDRFENSGLAMDDYERFDLVIEGVAGAGLRPYLRVDNLLDEDYEEVPGFTTPGRRFAAGLSWRR